MFQYVSLFYTLLSFYMLYVPSFISFLVTFIQDFFKKHGVAVMTIRELFDFIVDPTINDDSVDSYLEEVRKF